MSSPELIEIRFDNICVFDWYDGLVRAIGFKGDRAYLIILAAWDKKGELKIYLLIPLGGETARGLLELVEQCSRDLPSKQLLWDKLSDSVEMTLKNYQGNIYLSTREPTCEVNTLATVIVRSHLSKLSNYSYETLFEEDSIKYWRSIILREGS